MLEVVEHQQHPPVGQERCQGRADRVIAVPRPTERAGDRRAHEGGVGDRAEIDERDAVGERGPELGRESQREPRLAGARRTRQRDESHVRTKEQLPRARQLVGAADQPGRLGGQPQRPRSHSRATVTPSEGGDKAVESSLSRHPRAPAWAAGMRG